MKKIIYDGQETEEYIISTNDEIESNKEIIGAIVNVGQNLSHEIYEVGEIDDNIDPNEVIEDWMEVYFEDVQNGSIEYTSYLTNVMVDDNKIVQNYVCKIEYFGFKSKIKYHTES